MAAGGALLAVFSLVAELCNPSVSAAAMVSQAANANLLNIFMLTAPSRFLMEPCVTTRKTWSDYREWREESFVMDVTWGLTLGHRPFRNRKESPSLTREHAPRASRRPIAFLTINVELSERGG